MSDYIFSKLFDEHIEILVRTIGNIKKNNKGDTSLTGTYTECSFRNLLNNFIPQNIEISNGWIIDEKGDKGNERDIIIYDKNKAPAFLFSAGVGMIPQCSVLFDIQIKTTLNTKKDIRDAIKQIRPGNHYNAILSVYGKDQLKRYIEIDDNYFYNPKIKVFSSEQDSLYYFVTYKIKYSSLFPKGHFINAVESQLNKKLPKEALFPFILNGINVDQALDKTLKVCEWRRSKYKSNIKGFVSRLLDTLYRGNVSRYLYDENIPTDRPVIRALFYNENTLVNGSIIKNLKDGIDDFNTENLLCSITPEGKFVIQLRPKTS